MIKLLKPDKKNNRTWKLEVDGISIEKVKFTGNFDYKKNILDLFVWHHKTSTIFFNKKISEFLSLLSEETEKIEITISLDKNLYKNLNKLALDNLFPDDFLPIELKKEVVEDSDLSFFVQLNLTRNVTQMQISFIEFLFATQFWKHPFSLYEYFIEVRKHLTITNNDEANRLDVSEVINVSQFTFEWHENLTINEFLDYTISDLSNALQKAFESLSNQSKTQSLITKFSNFPEEVRVPCEQYLLFFESFLKDLGINVTTGITHEAGDILFSVTPSNPQQALDKIKTALDIYLQLPKSEIVIAPDEEFEIAMFKAKANIDHLNSQLSLAKAEIRVKEREIQAFEATLEAKDISIEFLREKLNQQKRLLNGEIAEGIIETEPKFNSDDKEEFFDGVIALKQYEDKGVQVNLAKLYRKLRDFFKD